MESILLQNGKQSLNKHHQKLSKKNKKMLDKINRMCYNKAIKRKGDTKMEKIYALTDREYEKLMELENEGWDKYYEHGRENMRTAFRKAFQFCARRGISEDEFWAWVND